jgi:hypothetical protein
MCKALRVAICGLLIAVFAIPALAGGVPHYKARRSVYTNFGGTMYHGSEALLGRTGDIFTGCLRRTFSLFNPCMDFVKGCSAVVFSPIERPLDYLEHAYYKDRPVRRVHLRVLHSKKPVVTK